MAGFAIIFEMNKIIFYSIVSYLGEFFVKTVNKQKKDGELPSFCGFINGL